MVGMSDTRLRKRGQRHGRSQGCRVNIPSEVLVEAGLNPADPPPYYTVRGYHRSRNGHTVIVSLYREP